MQQYGLEAQIEKLTAAGAEKVFHEHTSAVGSRPQFFAMLASISRGDVIVVTALDRLTRSMQDTNEVLSKLDALGVTLRILGFHVDTGTAAGKMMLHTLAMFAEHERSLLLERQREGIERAKAGGKYKGRPPKLSAMRAEVVRLRSEGIGASEIARRLGMSRRSVYRELEAATAA